MNSNDSSNTHTNTDSSNSNTTDNSNSNTTDNTDSLLLLYTNSITTQSHNKTISAIKLKTSTVRNFISFIEKKQYNLDKHFLMNDMFSVILSTFLKHQCYSHIKIVTKLLKIAQLSLFFNWCKTVDQLVNNHKITHNLNYALTTLKQKKQYMDHLAYNVWHFIFQ